MKEFTKKYQLWTRGDHEYGVQEFDTVKEAITADKYTTDWYVTKKVGISFSEEEDNAKD